jgi:pimeloyl-ACP methyl ester carboxylesterase
MKTLESKYFTLKNESVIYADVVGDGPLLLCLSGYANTNHNFKLLAPILAQNFTVCMIDARGMGKSSDALSEYTMNDLAHDAVEIAHQLGHHEYRVIGVSLGGYPAQTMALEFSQELKSMVLIATRGPGNEYEITRPVTEESFTAFMGMDPIQGNRLAVALFVHPNFIKNSPDKYEAVIDLRLKENKITLSQSLMQLRAGYSFINSDLDISKITCPTLIIAGDEDSFLPKQNALLLNKQINKSELVFIPETSHLCFLEKPEEIASLISKFFLVN